MAIKNTVSNDFDLCLLIVKSVFDCCLPGMMMESLVYYELTHEPSAQVSLKKQTRRLLSSYLILMSDFHSF